MTIAAVPSLSPSASSRFDFELPDGLEATAPPEDRGLTRDSVRLMVASHHAGIENRNFVELPSLLERGDVLAVNTSATLPAALDGRLTDGTPAELHLSGRLPGGVWVVELRHPSEEGSLPWFDAEPGTVVELAAGSNGFVPRVVLHTPFAADQPSQGRNRLWIASLDLDEPLLLFLARRGKPIRYGYVDHDRPIAAYQTVFADEPGSAEMPSAARPFSAEVVTRLVSRGVVFAPFVLHCGVASPEAHEPPMPEWWRLSPQSAFEINAAHRRGNRVIAVGTTAVRTLETAVDSSGAVHPGEGWTELVITPDRDIAAVDGLITGWHEPEASHLDLLEAVAGRPLLEASYRAALREGYLWHEFGDSHLLLP